MSRRRDPAAAKRPKGPWRPQRRRRALERRRRKAALLAGAALLLVPLALLALGRAFGGGDERAALPELLAPGDFAPHAEFRQTDRVGTLFKATLSRPPLGEDPDRFAADMHAVAGLAASAGYESVVVQAPDGTTLVTGSVHEPVVHAPSREGS